MGIEEVTAVSSEALYLVIKVSAPVLLVSLIVGLIISIFQTVTSIQEQTLTFVPKIIAVFLTLIVQAHTEKRCNKNKARHPHENQQKIQ